MGNFIHSASPRTPSAYFTTSGGTDTNSDASFPAANVGDYAHPWRRWRSSSNVNGATFIAIDLGSSLPVYAVFVDNCNVDGGFIESSESNTFGTTEYSSGLLTLTKDLNDDRYKVVVADASTPLQTSRYWRFRSNVSSPNTTDGDTKMRVGSFVVFSAASAFGVNAEFPMSFTRIDPTIDNDQWLGGGREPVGTGKPYCRITFGQSRAPNSEATNIKTLMAYGKARAWLFYRNFGSTSESYMVRRIGDVSVDQAGANHIAYSGLVLEEVV